MSEREVVIVVRSWIALQKTPVFSLRMNLLRIVDSCSPINGRIINRLRCRFYISIFFRNVPAMACCAWPPPARKCHQVIWLRKKSRSVLAPQRMTLNGTKRTNRPHRSLSPIGLRRTLRRPKTKRLGRRLRSFNHICRIVSFCQAPQRSTGQYMDWLREHMRNHIAASNKLGSAENVLSFKRPTKTAMDPAATALDLVYQAADRIKNINDCSLERQACAEALVEQAIEKLKVADARVKSAELNLRAAQGENKKLIDRVENEFNIKMQELETLMEQTSARVMAAHAQVSAAEQRTRDAETRASEAENALRRIEEALRTQIFQTRSDGARLSLATAA